MTDMINIYSKEQIDQKGYAAAADLATVATTGSYTDLTDTPTIPAAQVQADWGQVDSDAVDFIKNKPTIPAAQVQADWSQADSGEVDYIKNKPTIPAVVQQTGYWELTF